MGTHSRYSRTGGPDRQRRRSPHETEWSRALIASEGRCRTALRVSRALSAELEPQAVVTAFVRSMAGSCGDWCAVHVEDETGGGTLSEFTTTRSDQAWVTERARTFLRTPAARSMAAGMAGRHSVLVADVRPGWIDRFARSDDDRALLSALAPRSAVIVPFTLSVAAGVIVLASTSPARRFRPAHLAVAQELSVEFGRALERALRFHAVDQELVLIRDTTLASVSHDLRSPLHVITLAADSLRENMVPDEAIPRHLDAISSSARYMTSLVAELLEVTRAHREPPCDEPCRPADLIGHVVSSQLPLALRKGVRLVVDCEPTLPNIQVNANAVMRVLWNIVDNAVRACPPGDVVVVSAVQQDATMLFAVTNPGHGLDEQQARHVFEPFWTMNSRTGGTGLGLAISKRIIEAHGGAMWVDSAPAGPTTFRFRLPLTPSATPP